MENIRGEMISESLTCRASIFAYLFGPARHVARTEAMRVYDALCTSLSWEDLAFQYEQRADPTAPPGRSDFVGFSIVCKRSEDRAITAITVDRAVRDAPLRVLTEQVWPQSPSHVDEIADIASEAVLSALEPVGGDWQKLLAESRLRYQCSVPGNDGLGFLFDRLVKTRRAFAEMMGRVTVAGFRCESASDAPGGDSLNAPKRELSIEVLREDPRSLYLELVSQWAAVPLPNGITGPPSTAGIRPVDRTPAEYIGHERRFVVDLLTALESED